MGKKIPSKFRKPLTASRFEKKLLKKLYLKEDREFLAASYKKKEGAYYLKDSITASDFKRIKKLHKTARKNRGIFSTGKVGILLVAAAAALIFTFFLKDRIITRTAENMLESVFGADVEITGLKSSILSGEVSLGSLVIGDPDEPFRNLIETGYAELNIGMSDLLKKRLKIESAVCSQLKWNTERETSGFLDRSEEEKQETSSADMEPSEDTESSSPGGFLDPEMLIESQKDRFKSLKAVDAAAEEGKELPGRIEEGVDSASEAVGEVKNKIDSLSELSLKDPADAAEALEAVSGIRESIKQAQKEVDSVASDTREASRFISSSRSEIQESISSDYSMIEELVASPGESAKNIASGYFDSLLAEKSGKYYSLIKKGADILMGLKAGREEEVQRYKGEYVYFSTEGAPLFWLEHLELSGSDQGTELFISAENITSNTALTGQPVSFKAVRTKDESTTDLSGSFQLQEDGLLMDLNMSQSKTGFSLSEKLDSVSLSSIDGQYSMNAEIGYTSSPSVSGRTMIEASGLTAQPEGDSKLGGLVAGALEDAGKASFDISFLIEDGKSDFKVSSSLDNILSDILKGYLADMSDEIREDAKEMLADMLKEQSSEFEGIADQLEKLGGEQDLLENSLSDYEKQLDSIKTEAEKSIKDSAASGASDLLKDATGGLKLPF